MMFALRLAACTVFLTAFVIGQATGEFVSPTNGTSSAATTVQLDSGSHSDITITTGSIEIGTPDGQGGFTWANASVKRVSPNPGGSQKMGLPASVWVTSPALAPFSGEGRAQGGEVEVCGE